MKVRPLGEIMEEMRKHYVKHPKLRDRWRVLGGRDEHGFNDLFFYGPGMGIWQIKTEQKSPYELFGAGAKVAARKIDDEIRGLMEIGLPMPFGLMTPHPRLRDRATFAAGIGRYQDKTETLMEHFSSRERMVDAELLKRAEEMRRKLGLDIPYL